MTAQLRRVAPSTGPAGLRSVQLAWLAAAVFVVSIGYGALMPLLPGWLALLMPPPRHTPGYREDSMIIR